MKSHLSFRNVALIAIGLILISILVGLFSPKKVFAKVDLCRDLEISSRLLGQNASSFYAHDGRWPNTQELGLQLATSNSPWSSFSGGEDNWKLEVVSDKRFKITFVGEGRDKCHKVFFVDLPQQSSN